MQGCCGRTPTTGGPCGANPEGSPYTAQLPAPRVGLRGDFTHQHSLAWALPSLILHPPAPTGLQLWECSQAPSEMEPQAQGLLLGEPSAARN